jgi:hypothetical protein
MSTLSRRRRDETMYDANDAHTRRLVGATREQALAWVGEALATEGFGVPEDVDARLWRVLERLPS